MDIYTVVSNTVTLYKGLFLLAILVGYTNAQCPNSKDCSCQPDNSDIILYCRRQKLTTVPIFSSTNLYFSEVTLAANEITSLPANAFMTTGGTGLKTKKLDLTENRINSIDVNAFAGLGEWLEVLKLDVSGMGQFPPSALSRLPNLKQLYLKGFNMAQLPTNVFLNLTKLELLRLDSCGLNMLNVGDFSSQVNVLKEVYLIGNKFTTIPKQALSSLQGMTLLDLSRSQLSTVESNTFSGMNALVTLRLESNGIATIQTDAFKGVQDTLRFLSLKSNNEITQQTLYPLSILMNLEELDLSFNRINEIPKQFFTQMIRLKKLTANNNEIEKLENLSFQGLENSLVELNLRKNRINMITGSFAALKGLKILDLGDQDLSLTYNENTFTGLENILESLTLSTTKFSDIHFSSLAKLYGLKTLKLDGNSINIIPDNAFVNMNALQTLHLKSNKITNLQQQSFKGLQFSLEKIFLDSNSISTINKCVFHKFQKLNQVEMDYNPLVCDCQLDWLHKLVFQYHMQDNTFWACAGPPEHVGKMFVEIPITELTCTTTALPEICEDYTITTTQIMTTSVTTPAPVSTTTPMTMKIKDITDSTMAVVWQAVPDSSTVGWGVTCTDLNTQAVVYKKTFAITVRQSFIENLRADSHYFVCVRAIYSTSDSDPSNTQVCSSEKTMPKGGNIVPKDNNMLIILGSVLGGVLLLLIIGITLCCLIKRRNKRSAPKFEPEDFDSSEQVPMATDQSKRFSKPKSASMLNLNRISTTDIDRHLIGYTPQERVLLMKLLSKSTTSMLGAAPQRYSQQPNGDVGGIQLRYNTKRRPGIDPPSVAMSELQRQVSGSYHEIPTDTYDEIPADQVNGVEYNMPDEEAMCKDLKEKRHKSTGNILDGHATWQ